MSPELSKVLEGLYALETLAHRLESASQGLLLEGVGQHLEKVTADLLGAVGGPLPPARESASSLTFTVVLNPRTPLDAVGVTQELREVLERAEQRGMLRP